MEMGKQRRSRKLRECYCAQYTKTRFGNPINSTKYKKSLDKSGAHAYDNIIDNING